jgi:hypothetical protein
MSRSSRRPAWARWDGSPAVRDTPDRLASTSAGRLRPGGQARPYRAGGPSGRQELGRLKAVTGRPSN